MTASANTDFYSIPLKTIEGKTQSLNDFKGKVLLVVNTASECGYTPQYEGLEKLHDQYKEKGLVVLGFPSNDFGGQEPGSNAEIAKFCKLRFGVSFPLFEKAPVKGDSKQALFKALIAASSDKSEVKWNFEKFLIDRQGQITRFGSKAEPTGPEIKKALEAALAAK